MYMLTFGTASHKLKKSANPGFPGVTFSPEHFLYTILGVFPQLFFYKNMGNFLRKYSTGDRIRVHPQPLGIGGPLK